MNKEKEKQLIKLAMQKPPLCNLEIAQIIGLNISTISLNKSRLRKEGKLPSLERAEITPEMRAKAVKMKENGKTRLQIARALKLSKSQTNSLLSREKKRGNL